MRINIKNLGPVSNAELSIDKRLTVICGVNSTGKTYVSYLLYFIFSENQAFAFHPFINVEIGDNNGYSFVRKDFDDWLDRYSSYVKGSLPSIFGISNSQAQSLLGNFSLTMTMSDSDFDEIVSQSFRQEMLYSSNYITILKRKKSKKFKFLVKASGSKALSDDNLKYVLSVAMNMVFKRLLLHSYRSFMMTVERNSIYTFKTELSLTRNELLNKIVASTDGSAPSPILVNRYPLAVFDSLKYANDLDNISKHESEYYQYAVEMETQLMGGTVKTTDKREISLQVGDKTIPIHMTSSIVKTLSSLVFYLKYQAMRGDVVLIDEPEMNFHPYNQIVVARLLAILVNKGIRFIVSTHSDYIIREINNLVMAGALVATNREYVEKQAGYTPDQILSKNDLRAYSFDLVADGNVNVEELEVSRYGFDVKSINAAIDSQNSITNELFDRLTYEEASDGDE